MKIKIDKNGILSIWRKNQWKQQGCRFAGIYSKGGGWFCGDTCPLFGEPFEVIDNPDYVVLNLYCGFDAVFTVKKDDLIDER